MRTFIEFLTESDDRVDPKKLDIQALFRQLNATLFDGKLDNAIPVKWGRTPKSAAGITNGKAINNGFFRKTVPGTISITISPYAYKEDVLKGILAHEMCHAFNIQFDQHERDSHGIKFQLAVLAAQKHANFSIPMKHHQMESEEYGEPKPVMFMAGENRDGKMAVWLYNARLAQDPSSVGVARINVERLVKDMRYRWSVIGMANTNLGNAMVVARQVKGPGGTASYILKDPKALKIQQIFHSDGPVPFQHF